MGFLKKVFSRLHKAERGYVSMSGLLMMGIAMIFIAVGFIIFPVILDGTDGILAWTSGNLTVANFTGLASTVGIFPLIALLGFVASGVLSGFLGFQMVKSGQGKMDSTGLLMLAVGQIFIAVGLIMFPVVLDGCATVLTTPSLASYVGLAPIIKVCPLIVLVTFLAGGVVSSYFGYKGAAKAAMG